MANDNIQASSAARTNAHVERRVGQETLLQSAAQCQAIFDNAIEAIICISTHGTITHANTATETIFGYSLDELIGHNIARLMPSPHRENHDTYLKNYLETGERKIIGIGRELTGIRKDGGKVPIELSVAEIYVNGKRSFTGIIRDISERKAAERLLKQREKEIRQVRDKLAQVARLHMATEISAAIAHEINQPLTAIALYAQSCRRLIHNSEASADALENLLTRIDNQVQRASQVIYSLRSGHRQQEQQKALDINELIKRTVELANLDINPLSIGIKCNLSPGIPPMDAMEIQIQQVLLNLLYNARDALATTSKTDKRISITSELSPNGFVKVSVRDNGPGVKDDDIENIFRAFFTTKESGMGLGLAICRSIIDNHGGELSINATYPSGAEFVFRLPVGGAHRS